MNREIILKFKSMFEIQKNQILFAHSTSATDFEISKDDLLDDTDLCSTEMEQSMRMRLRNRETLYLKKIDEALARIKDGNFGECDSCSEDIELRRLEARPTATLCVSCKEEDERREMIHIDGHKTKSMGTRLRLA